MIGSPNYFYGIYNGSEAKEDIRNGSVAIENLFTEYMNNNNFPFVLTSFDGRSDYGVCSYFILFIIL